MEKRMKKMTKILICLSLFSFLFPVWGIAGENIEVYPAAVFPFQEKGSSLQGYGEKVSDLLFVFLSMDSSLIFVDRQEIDKVLDEQELSMSGMVNPNQAVQVGKLTGAKILITGSLMEIDNKLYIIAKIIGTETSKILAESVNGDANAEFSPLVESLATKVSEKINSSAKELVAAPESVEDRIEKIKAKLGKKDRPSVSVSIAERHVSQATIDPAAETEITKFCSETGFTIFDSKSAASKKADISIVGEGFSEFAARRKNIVSVKARLEVKAIDNRTGKIIDIDRETVVEVDLTEQIAGKKALQSAAAKIAERMLPKLVQ
jgi:curli production assembly/transport component CsgG